MTERKKEDLKAFIALEEDVRKSYQREKSQKIASIIASVNKKGSVQSDVTANKRFLCFDINSIDYNHNISIDMVLAQALSLYKKGFTTDFTVDEISEIKGGIVISSETTISELVKTFIEVSASEGRESEENTPAEIMKVLLYKAGIERDATDGDIITLGKILTKEGFTFRILHGGVKKYKYKGSIFCTSSGL